MYIHLWGTEKLETLIHYLQGHYVCKLIKLFTSDIRFTEIKKEDKHDIMFRISVII